MAAFLIVAAAAIVWLFIWECGKQYVGLMRRNRIVLAVTAMAVATLMVGLNWEMVNGPGNRPYVRTPDRGP